MGIKAIVREWLNRPSRQEIRSRALDARLNDIEAEIVTLAGSVAQLEARAGIAPRDSWPLSSPESAQVRDAHRAAEGC